MTEQATKEEILRVVMGCCEPMAMVQEPEEFHFDLTDNGCLPARLGVPRRFTMLSGVPPQPGQACFVVNPATLADALSEIRIQRPTQDEEVAALRRPADRLRAELGRKIENSWDPEETARARVQALEAFIAGLDMRLPSEFRDDFKRLSDRMAKEADPEWSTYRQLSRKFEGERP
jgi:hypothetical protein